MKTHLARGLSVLLVLAALSAEAQQRSDGNWVNVQATVTGVFDFRIDGADHTQAAPANYDFGAVSHRGTNGGVITGGRAYYSRNGVFTWDVVSAPQRQVDIVLRNPSKPVEPSPGGMALNQLSIELTVLTQAVGGSGTSSGKLPIAAGAVLVDNALAGDGTSEAGGAINLELYVDGNDREGLNTWLFELEATGI